MQRSAWLATSFVFGLVASLSIAGCGDDEKSSELCEGELAPFATGDLDGHPAPLGAGPGESRAGRLQAADLPDELDRHGLAVWAPGDFVLANDRVALIIEDVGTSDLFDPHGGRPVGIARVSDGALVDAGDFNEVIFGVESYLVKTESVSVINDGSDGRAASIRATGPLGAIQFLGDVLKIFLPGAYDDYPAAIDYVMEPGSDAIDVYITVGNPSGDDRSVRQLMLAFFQSNRMARWSEIAGFADPAGPVEMNAFIDDEGASFAWLPPEDRTLTQFVEIAGALAFSVGGATLERCAESRLSIGTLVLGAGRGLPGLQASLARHRGETTRTVVGAVTDDEGQLPATDARVHVLRADGSHYARLQPDGDGMFEVEVPNEPVTFIGYRMGTRLSDPVTVTPDTDLVEISMPPFSTLVVTVSDEANLGEVLPSRVQVLPQEPLVAPVIPADFGEVEVTSGRSHIAFITGEPLSLRVDPGAHQVVMSRGFEWSVDTEMVELAPADVEPIEGRLVREVNLPGVMCADYHIHTHRSPDSPDSPQFKLAGMIADGLEIAIRTDHEWIRDFDPVIQSMGLDAYAFGIGGEELTTFMWGHFNLFPLEEDPTRRNGGALEWVGRMPPEVFAEARGRHESPSLIINHPRSGGSLGGYFAAAGLDPDTGMVAHPDYWDEEFTLVEVFNDADFESVRDTVVADWFSLLNTGRRVFAVGSSDSHALRTAPVGYPRTCLDLGVDDALALRAQLDPVRLIQSTTDAGRSTISGGAYLTVEGPSGEGPGEDVPVSGEDVDFRVRVLAASWVQGLAFVEVIVDGHTIDVHVIEDEPAELPDPTDLAVRFDQEIVIPIEEISPQGSWVVFHVSSDGANDLLAPVHPGGRRPFAVSNPIFLTP